MIVKPVDSAGSKGVTKVEDKADLQNAIETALSASLSKHFVIEDFLDKVGAQSSADIFTVDGKLVYPAYSDQLFDKEAARAKITAALKDNYYYASREWPYKKVVPRIIAEQYMEDKNGAFVDYKFSCFNGHVENVMVCLDRHINDVKFYFFDRAWNLQRLNIRGKNAPKDFTIPKPDSMDEMFDIAAKLSKDMPYVRVDLFECDGKIYFGEMTFFPDCGFDAKLLPETDAYFGKLLDLSKIKK